MIDPHCTATRKCWEHYQPEPRVTERTIDLAIALVRLRAATDRTTLPLALWLLQVLLRRQWNEMVREPFDFPQRKEVTEGRSPNNAPKRRPASLSDLLF